VAQQKGFMKVTITKLPNGSTKIEVIIPLTMPSNKEYFARLQNGETIICPQTRRGQITTMCKKAGIYTHQTTISPEWIMFKPCEKREFKN